MQQLQTTKAAVVWSYFLEICSIPHASRNELQLVNWIKNWADKQEISYVQDKIGNLILRKPPTIGYEHKTPVILQAHLDMVPQKNSDTKHDFLTDAIQPVIKGEWMHASNTTLGADNGIGMASCLAILADKTIQHGPLEVLLTTAEEVGMIGAFGLEEGLLNGNILINTDSEQEGDLYIGCAGGVKLFIDLPYKTETISDQQVAFEISLNGLKGGHSGCDIHLQRVNAIILLAESLSQIDNIPFSIAKFKGGSLRNAIPREAHVIISCEPHYQTSLEQQLNHLQTTLLEKHQGIEDDLSLSLSNTELPNQVLTKQSKDALLSAIKSCPNGVFAMDKNLQGVVQTSSNIGVFTQENNVFTMELLVRSQVEEEKQQAAIKIAEHFKNFGARSRQEGNYPGWKPNPNSPTFQATQKVYQKLFNCLPKTMVIHAGLECGLFSNKYPHWDMVSFGPTIKFPHSPDEKVHIESVDKYWQLLVSLLQELD